MKISHMPTTVVALPLVIGRPIIAIFDWEYA